MVPLSLRLRNFMCYRGDTPPLLLEGVHVACLSGQNGHGKSALLDAMTWALWGQARARSDDDLIHLGQTEMEVELEFRGADGGHYRVVRKRSKPRSGRGAGQTSLELHVLSADGDARPITGGTVRETQRRLIDLLKLDYETFVNSAFLVQGRADAFTLKTPAERKQVLSDILGLGVYDQLEERARELARDAEGRLAQHTRDLEDLDRELQGRDDLEDLLLLAEREFDALQRETRAHETLVIGLRERKQALDLQAALLQDLERRLGENQAALERHHAEVETETVSIRRYREALAQREDVQAGLAALATARQQAEDLAWRLGEVRLREQEANRLAQAIAGERAKLEQQVRLFQAETDGLRPKADHLPDIAASLAALEEDAARLEQVRTAVAEQQRTAQDLSNQVQRQAALLEDLDRRLGDHQSTLERYRVEIANENGNIRRYEEALARREEVLAGVAQLAAARQAAGDFARRLSTLFPLREEAFRLEQEVARARADLDREVQSLQSEADGLRPKAQAVGRAIAALADLEEDAVHLERDQAAVAERQQVAQGLSGRAHYLLETNQRSREEMIALKAKLDQLVQTPGARCPLCGTELGEDGKAHIEEQYQQQGEALRDQYRANEQEQRRIEQELKATQEQIAAETGQLTRTAEALTARRTTLTRERVEGQEAVRLLAELEPMLAAREAALAGRVYAQQQQDALTALQLQIASLAYDEAVHRQIVESVRELEPYEGLARALNEAERLLDLSRTRARQAEDTARQFQEQFDEDSRQREDIAATVALRVQELQVLQGTVSVETGRLTQASDGLTARRATLLREQEEGRQAALRLGELTPVLEATATALAGGAYAADEQVALAAVREQITGFGYDEGVHQRAVALVRDLEQYEAQARAVDEADRLLAVAETRLRQAEEIARRLQEQSELDRRTRETIAAGLEARPAVERDLSAAEEALAELRTRASRQAERVGGLRQQQERLAALVRIRRDREEAQAVARRERDAYSDLAAAFGKRGIQALVIETALPELQDEANRLLGRMTDNRMSLTLETQRQTRAGTVVETLDIRIADELGTRDYELFSGGEAFRINFALRIALSRLLARRAGAPMPTLIIDEGFGTQDSAGREKLVEVLNAIQDDFERILVITHIDELKDLFPVRIEVVKTAQGSTFSLVA